MTSILDGVQEFVTPSFLSRVSSQTGESEAAVSKGFAAVLPTLLASIANRSADPGFMSQLARLATNTASDPDAFTRLTEPGVTPEGVIDASTRTGGWLSSLTGGSFSGLTSGVSRYAGLRASSASSLLTYGVPLVLGYLGRLMRTDHLDASTLAKRFQAERRSIAAALPAGFDALVPGTEATQIVAHAVPAEKPRGWLLPLALLALAIAGLLWWGSRERAATVVDTASSAIGAANPAVPRLSRSLPNGIQVSIPAGGMEERLISYIAAPGGTDGSFDFDRIGFHPGTSSLTAQSRDQIVSVASILKAYPTTRVVISGYTDNSGVEATNLAISRGRAEAVMDALRNEGVPAVNMQARGFGSQNPIADNSTEAGRERNRRVTLSVS
jgi:outer membrane protein OmpA-like peptidoglycan-associated protein